MYNAGMTKTNTGIIIFNFPFVTPSLFDNVLVLLNVFLYKVSAET